MDTLVTHAVTIRFDKVGRSPDLTFECTAPAGAECRTICPRSECEEGCTHVGEPGHEPVDLGHCNVTEWLNNMDDVECSVIDDTEVCVPFTYQWAGSDIGPEWRFA